jgi:predicted TPR repeat methyltransferase
VRAGKEFCQSLFDTLGVSPGWEQLAHLVDYGGARWLRSLSESLSCTPSNILDVGCADGYLGRRLREAGYRGRLVGLDFSAPLLEQCRCAGDYDALHLCDVENPWPVIAGHFDLVIAFGVMEFISSQGRVLSALRRALTQHGTLWITFEDRCENPEPYVWKTLRSRADVLNLLTARGFQVSSIERVSAGRCVHRRPDQTLEIKPQYIPYFLVAAERVPRWLGYVELLRGSADPGNRST